MTKEQEEVFDDYVANIAILRKKLERLDEERNELIRLLEYEQGNFARYKVRIGLEIV